jgi:hypothetical protein
MAIAAGTVRVRGVDFDILPWTEAEHGRESTWWYHVHVAIENLQIHAWNAQVARQILGDDCLFDRIETATFRQESTDIFFLLGLDVESGLSSPHEEDDHLPSWCGTIP